VEKLFFFRRTIMAKKSAKAKKAKTAHKSGVKIHSAGKAGHREQAGKNKKSKLIVAAVIVVALALTAMEVLFVAKQQVKKGKKPEFVRMWDHHPYTGISFFREFGDSLYGVDDNKGQVVQFDKITGRVIHLYNQDSGALACIVDSKNNLNILDKANTIYRYNKNFKFTDKILLSGIGAASWIDIDSKGNILVADGQAMTVHKYDPALNPLLVFGKKGGGGGEFQALLKLFVGPDDDIYCLAGVDAVTNKSVSVFGKDGRFKRAWQIRNVNKFSRLDHLAITPDGYVYMNSDATNRIYVYDKNGDPVSNFDTCAANACVISYPGCITGGIGGILYIYTHQIVVVKDIQY
jgi:hypothetical protein